MLTKEQLTENAASVRRWAIRMCPQEGEDLAQAALMKAWRRREAFRDGADPVPWLRSVLVRVFLTHCRDRRSRSEALARIAVPQAPVGCGQHSISSCLNGEQVEHGSSLAVLRVRIEDALSRLSADHQKVIRAVDVRGASYLAAAAEIGCPLGTVMSRLHRARRAAEIDLRESLQ